MKYGFTDVLKESSSLSFVFSGGIPRQLLAIKFKIFDPTCLPSGHFVSPRPLKFKVIVLILTLFVTVTTIFPLTMAPIAFEEESRVVPSWSSPVRNTTGSARTILHEIPLPAQRGLSASDIALLVFGPEAVLMLPLGLALPATSDSEGLDIIAGLPAAVPVAILLAKIVDGSADASERELLTDDGGVIGLCGLRGVTGVAGADLGGLVVVGVETAEEVGEEKLERVPSTRFADPVEANLLSSTRNLEGVFGSGGGG